MGGGVFISYRRGDADGQVRALVLTLSALIGKDSVFMDVDSIALGSDFRQALQERLDSCDFMFVLIGREWLDAKDESGNRRLDDPSDYVRQEIAGALKRNIPVTPVLVQGARMPTVDRLPESIKDLAFRNGIELSHNRWESDVHEMFGRLNLRKESRRSPVPYRLYGAIGIGLAALLLNILWGTPLMQFLGSSRSSGHTLEPGSGEPTARPAHPTAPRDENQTSGQAANLPTPPPVQPANREAQTLPKRQESAATKQPPESATETYRIALEVVGQWDRARIELDKEALFALAGQPMFFAGSYLLNKADLWDKLQEYAARGRAAQARATEPAPGPRRRPDVGKLNVLTARELKNRFSDTEGRNRIFGEVLKNLGLTLDDYTVEQTRTIYLPSQTARQSTMVYLLRRAGEKMLVVGEIPVCGKCDLSR